MKFWKFRPITSTQVTEEKRCIAIVNRIQVVGLRVGSRFFGVDEHGCPDEDIVIPSDEAHVIQVLDTPEEDVRIDEIPDGRCFYIKYSDLPHWKAGDHFMRLSNCGQISSVSFLSEIRATKVLPVEAVFSE